VQGPGDAFEAAIELFLVEPLPDPGAPADDGVEQVPVTIAGGCSAVGPSPLCALLLLTLVASRRRRRV